MKYAPAAKINTGTKASEVRQLFLKSASVKCFLISISFRKRKRSRRKTIEQRWNRNPSKIKNAGSSNIFNKYPRMFIEKRPPAIHRIFLFTLYPGRAMAHFQVLSNQFQPHVYKQVFRRVRRFRTQSSNRLLPKRRRHIGLYQNVRSIFSSSEN